MIPGERYVVLGLAHVRSPWFRDMARWATSAALPCEFVKCVSVEEVRARLRSGRAFSALLVDGSLPGIDRDLFDVAREAGCSVLVVDDGRVERDWASLGATAMLPAGFERDELLDTLDSHATPIDAHVAAAASASASVGRAASSRPTDGWRAPLVAVTGGGGTGVSLVAMAIAQGLADDDRNAGMVLLADLALNADQAMLHDAGDVVPGVQELVEAHRLGRPTTDDVRALAFDVATRRYHLLLGLRRHRDWAAVRPRAFEAALDGARHSYRVVVADVDPELEGEQECGSIDVEERNTFARTTIGVADAVVVIGLADAKGIHTLARVVRDVAAFGVDPAALLMVVNRAPRAARRRAELARTVGILTKTATASAAGVASPIFLSEHKHIDRATRDASRLPAALTGVIARAVMAVVERATPAPAPRPQREPERVRPGSLGSWTAP